MIAVTTSNQRSIRCGRLSPCWRSPVSEADGSVLVVVVREAGGSVVRDAGGSVLVVVVVTDRPASSLSVRSDGSGSPSRSGGWGGTELDSGNWSGTSPIVPVVSYSVH